MRLPSPFPCPALHPPAAHGLKFAQSKVAYHSQEIPGISGKYANPPVQVRAAIQAAPGSETTSLRSA